MAEKTGGLGNWIKNNVAAILIPTLSFALAIVVSYGTSIREETVLLTRIDALEQQVLILKEQDKEFDDDQDQLEDNLRDAISDLTTAINTTSRNVENMVIREGRDLERTMIRVESRVDNLARRMQLFDGIGAPAATTIPSFSIDSMDLLPEATEE